MSNRNTKAYDVIADRIIEALDKGQVPWRKPWSLKPGMHPQSLTGRPYWGINALVLGLSPYSDPRWLTYRKAIKLGGHVRRGQKSTPVVLWKPFEREVESDDGKTEVKTYWLLRYYSVFNVEQCDGLSFHGGRTAIETPEPFDPIAAAESIVANMPNKPPVSHDGGDRAYYVPALDTVHLPPRTAFDGAGEYYSTVFHELGHATGHKSRLDRHGMETGIAPFGSPLYSKEELAAEFAAAFLCNEAGIENTIENSAAYVQGWAKKLRTDKRLVVTAASQGQRAADYVLGQAQTG
jgi:antirestriction protein ArdC